jgi:uroporphyrin-III C-methyltransferase/precorrin-2 dehydrogenase/sirohydrochlorin ferrochelatase
MLFPVFLKLIGRRVLLVGGGAVAASKLRALVDAGAAVTVVAPSVGEAIAAQARLGSIELRPRPFEPADLDGVCFVIAAAPRAVNREVAVAAHARGLLVNAVDDVESASAYLGGVVRRAGVTLAVSTDGVAPALAGLLREALEAVLPDEAELERWVVCARELRRSWMAGGVPVAERRPLLLDALVALYGGAGRDRGGAGAPRAGDAEVVS